MISIVIPQLPTLNEYISTERENRFLAARMKKDATELVYWSAKGANAKPIDNIRKITCIWTQENKKKDPDNIAFALKFILDGLQKAEIIQNDGWSLWKVDPRIIHKFQVGRKEEVLITLQ